MVISMHTASLMDGRDISRRHSLHQFVVRLGLYIMDPATSVNQMGMAHAVQVLKWNESILTPLGIWPTNPNNMRFTLALSCLVIQVVLEFADLFQSGNTLEHIVANLTENITFTTITFQVILLRLNCRQLKEVIDTMREDFHEENYKSCEERKVFLAYYKQSRMFFLTAVPMGLSTAVTMYLVPLAGIPGMKNRNETVRLSLPYQTRMFHDVSELHSYVLTYAAQLPFVFISAFGHVGPDCLILTLMLHLCGQLFVLVECINNVGTDYRECGLAIKKCVQKHVRLIRVAKNLEESYNVILLIQLSGGTILICILTYNVLANTGAGQKAHFLNSSLYVLTISFLIYVYCFMGECLIQESTRVHHALTQRDWSEMPLKYNKMLIICMGRAQKPLTLTAGKFYIFSMRSFVVMEMSSAVQLLKWNERLLSLLGLWPLSANDTRFTLSLSCLLIHVILEYIDLYQFGNNFEHVVANLSENITYTTIVIQVILLRVNSRQLGQIIRAVYEDFVDKNYKTSVEKKFVLDNYKKARIFFAIAVPMTLSTAVSYFLIPLVNLLGTIAVTVNRNSTVELKLPYHTYIFYDVSNVQSYVLTYAAHLPFVFFASFGYIGPNCFIVTLTLHVCGQLSVLVERIKNINADGQECGLAIKIFVEKHVRLIRITQTLEEVYNVILLCQLLGGTILICVLSYHVLANADGEKNSDFFSFTLYILNVILYIFVYCKVGENLIKESTKVHDALSACRWYDMSSVHAKMLIICMARSKQPLILTAGKFYTFSMGSFANVMKSSMAYLSVLRSLL
ncbi:uncharacterized protein LOC124406469 [Diprion similis]|uniref:uncharacterized protein LOC124406469 n=1 Tax=Diprion similis TaxID=362088 RepID=UPI001EF7BA57|nr:uncharacterized protein LOC124406469 [Diprion similis]